VGEVGCEDGIVAGVELLLFKVAVHTVVGAAIRETEAVLADPGDEDTGAVCRLFVCWLRFSFSQCGSKTRPWDDEREEEEMRTHHSSQKRTEDALPVPSSWLNPSMPISVSSSMMLMR